MSATSIIFSYVSPENFSIDMWHKELLSVNSMNVTFKQSYTTHIKSHDIKLQNIYILLLDTLRFH